MEELIAVLDRAAKAYYSEDIEIISNYEYDALYDELVALEEATGVVLSGSPTGSVGYEAVDNLPKEKHDSPMLSLAKTKSREDLKEWLGRDGSRPQGALLQEDLCGRERRQEAVDHLG